MTEILFLYAIFAALVGVWNRNRGNSFWVGFLLSLLVSPLIGVIIVGVTSKNLSALEKRQVSSGEMKKCPACAELIKVDAIICKHCHHEFPRLPEEPPDVKANRLAAEKAKHEAEKIERAAQINSTNRIGRIMTGMMAALVIVVLIVSVIIVKKDDWFGSDTQRLGKSLVKEPIGQRPPATGDAIATEQKLREHQRSTPQIKKQSTQFSVDQPKQPIKKVLQHIFRIEYPSGSKPTFNVVSGFQEFGVGDSVSPVALGSDEWSFVKPRYTSQYAPIGVIIYKTDTLIEVGK